MANYTVFTSYFFIPTGTTTKGCGYSQAIHCNYIKALPIITDSLSSEEIRISFTNPLANEFKFLSDDITNGTGYTANKICILIQTGITTTPDATKWKYHDVTDQTAGTPLTPAKLRVTFKIPLKDYNTYSTYNITDFISYPSKLPIDDTKLCFGDEIYFLGNVITEIHSDVFTTDLTINLPLNEFNSSTNATWDSTIDSVSISEIGIYDDSTPKNLVAIGKLNNPIEKKNTISRTIVFAIDF